MAQPFKTVNCATGVDLKTGRPILDSANATHQGRLTKGVDLFDYIVGRRE